MRYGRKKGQSHRRTEIGVNFQSEGRRPGAGDWGEEIILQWARTEHDRAGYTEEDDADRTPAEEQNNGDAMGHA